MDIYSSSSRYFNGDTEFDIAQPQLLKSNHSYYTVTVLPNEAGRLDLVSFRVYDTPINWWIIARFNAIINPAEVQPDSVLRIPIL